MLNQLEIELLFGVAAKRRIGVRQAKLKVVRTVESVRMDTFRCQSVHIMIIASMLAKEARSWRIMSLCTDLELKNQLFRLSRPAQSEIFLSVCSLDFKFSPVLVDFDPCLVRDNEAARVFASRIVDVHGKVGHFTSHEKVL